MTDAMPVVNLAEIEGYLAQYGWKYERLDDASLVTGFRSKSRSYSLFLRGSEEWLLFSILDFVAAPAPDRELALLRRIIRYNLDSVFAKVATDDNGNIVVVADLPMRSISYDLFVEALEAFCFFAEGLFTSTLLANAELGVEGLASSGTQNTEASSNVQANK